MAKLTKTTLKYMGAVKDFVMPSPEILRNASTDMESTINECVKTLEDLVYDKYKGLFATISESDAFDTDFKATLKDYIDAIRTLKMASGSFGYGLVKAANELKNGYTDTNPNGDWQNP